MEITLSFENLEEAIKQTVAIADMLKTHVPEDMRKVAAG